MSLNSYLLRREAQEDRAIPVGFHEGLQALLVAKDEATSRKLLLQTLKVRKIAGVVFICQPCEELYPAAQTGIWGEDLSGNLGKVSALDVELSTTKKIPLWLHQWLIQRKKPLCFSQITRLIPFSSKILLKATGTSGAPPLADFLLTPYSTEDVQYVMIMGHYEQISDELMNELVSYSYAYMAKWISLLPEHKKKRYSSERLKLSKVELECIRWIAAGKTLEEVATITNMSYSNVRYHLNKARERSPFVTTHQLVVQAAFDYGLSPYGRNHESRHELN